MLLGKLYRDRLNKPISKTSFCPPSGHFSNPRESYDIIVHELGSEIAQEMCENPVLKPTVGQETFSFNQVLWCLMSLIYLFLKFF